MIISSDITSSPLKRESALMEKALQIDMNVSMDMMFTSCSILL